MNDTQAMNSLIAAGLAMFSAGAKFARTDDPAAYDALARVTKGTTPRIELTFGPNEATVRGLLIGDDGEPVAQVFEMNAVANAGLDH